MQPSAASAVSNPMASSRASSSAPRPTLPPHLAVRAAMSRVRPAAHNPIELCQQPDRPPFHGVSR
eukprot:9618008-Lingulodinium_polyedra.AAC.1